ncbi:hypothetical protein OG884_02535 [Streptosporangium sp. NBC_01755]|uniref:hypothetical protein n=1 Tax=unclassified Streptosporangium TaxID=2632669 RepID=UPI002DDBB0C1|nr:MULTISPECIES: hypothetical protein [unclassified Streptosporangium]WSA27690.1 hypothetical protein OIE13_07400 [Streptosporangium sp. NBC_01810]WSD00836.1 hypothetical protein OG884_02535 [Streptosporangium sp. NBC_01755]
MSDEFDYFRDRHLGKLLDLALQLSTDLHVANQRLHGLEALLVRHGVVAEGELDSLVPDEAERRILERQRDAMMNRLIRIIAESGPAEHPLRDQWEAALAAKAG